MPLPYAYTTLIDGDVFAGSKLGTFIHSLLTDKIDLDCVSVVAHYENYLDSVVSKYLYLSSQRLDIVDASFLAQKVFGFLGNPDLPMTQSIKIALTKFHAYSIDNNNSNLSESGFVEWLIANDTSPKRGLSILSINENESKHLMRD